MLVPAINSVIKMIMALDAVASLVRPRPHAATPTKGRLIRCTVLGSTPKRAAIFRTPSVRSGALSAVLEMTDQAIHEWAGLIIYRLAGRTSKLFPAP
jgi:hypothetical protein